MPHRHPDVLNALPTAVYRFFDADDRLLYVGITIDPKMRWPEHRMWSPWWKRQTRVEVSWYPDRKSARLEEVRAIKEEAPTHNREGRDPSLPPAPEERIVRNFPRRRRGYWDEPHA